MTSGTRPRRRTVPSARSTSTPTRSVVLHRGRHRSVDLRQGSPAARRHDQPDRRERREDLRGPDEGADQERSRVRQGQTPPRYRLPPSGRRLLRRAAPSVSRPAGRRGPDRGRPQTPVDGVAIRIGAWGSRDVLDVTWSAPSWSRRSPPRPSWTGAAPTGTPVRFKRLHLYVMAEEVALCVEGPGGRQLSSAGGQVLGAPLSAQAKCEAIAVRAPWP